MSYSEFLNANRMKLLGHFLLARKNGIATVDTPFPPAVLEDDQLDDLKYQLQQCFPLNSMICDLHDWDVHFENDLGDDWYFDAIFSDEDHVDPCAEQLTEFFLRKCDEFGMDYNQTVGDNQFNELVLSESRKFLLEWRQAVFERYTGKS